MLNYSKNYSRSNTTKKERNRKTTRNEKRKTVTVSANCTYTANGTFANVLFTSIAADKEYLRKTQIVFRRYIQRSVKMVNTSSRSYAIK